MLINKTLVLIKLGGSIITDKQGRFTFREENVKRLAAEIAAAQQARPDLAFIIGHGAGSFGHVAAHEHGFNLERKVSRLPEAIAHVNAAVHHLHYLLLQSFIEAGVYAISFHASSAGISQHGKLISLSLMALQSALELGAVPLLHGDIVVDEDGGWGIVSTEEIFIYLAPRLNPQHLILVGEVAGVFTDDPLKNPDVHLIPEITLKNIADVESMLSGSHGIDVTGGMSSKVMSLFALTQQLPHLQITFISGNQPKALEQILLGKRLNESTVMRFK